MTRMCACVAKKPGCPKPMTRPLHTCEQSSLALIRDHAMFSMAYQIRHECFGYDRSNGALRTAAICPVPSAGLPLLPRQACGRILPSS